MLTEEAVHKLQVAVLYQAVRDFREPDQRADVKRFLNSRLCEFLYNPFKTVSFADILEKLEVGK